MKFIKETLVRDYVHEKGFWISKAALEAIDEEFTKKILECVHIAMMLTSNRKKITIREEDIRAALKIMQVKDDDSTGSVQKM